MASRGQRFELDLDADNFTANLLPNEEPEERPAGFIVKKIQERTSTGIPTAPKFKVTATGFPEHRKRSNVSAFKKRQTAQPVSSYNPELSSSNAPKAPHTPFQVPPSDRAIAHHVAKKHGYDPEAKEKAEISEENKQRIAEMSTEDIEETRAELMANLSPSFLERLLRRANIDEDAEPAAGVASLEQAEPPKPATEEQQRGETTIDPETREPEPTQSTVPQTGPSIHFPVPPRDPSTFIPLDPNSSSFTEDLRTHYFPQTPHDPSTLSWLQDPTPQEVSESEYNPTNPTYAPSSVRFSFTGTLIPPKESLDIDVSKGLHHHGLAPSSAGYTIPELAILARSTLPNQRCIAYQLLGRTLYRLGRGDFGPRGSDLQDGLWNVVEQERVVEIMMREANRGHVSAKAYATEALWLWRKGGGGDRGLLKEGETKAK